MSDEHLIESASEFLEEQTEEMIKAITSAVPRGRIGAPHCLECGETIPDERRLGGYSKCVECVRYDEAMAKRFGGGCERVRRI